MYVCHFLIIACLKAIEHVKKLEIYDYLESEGGSGE